MPLPPTIAQAILETVIGRLALVFLTGAGGDFVAARQAASQMLAAHGAQTPDELALAAEIVSLQFHTLEALSDAADPELSLNKILRLRGGAVSLSRESHKARRRLDQLKRIRAATQPAPVLGETTRPQPSLERAQTPTVAAKDPGTSAQNWSQALEKRLAAQLMAEKLERNRQDHANQNAFSAAAAGLAPVAVLGSNDGMKPFN